MDNPVQSYQPDPADFATDPKTGVEYVKNILIVYFQASATIARREAARIQCKGKLVGHADILDRWDLEVELESYGELTRMGKRLERMPGVNDAGPDRVSHVVPQIWPNDPWGPTSASVPANRWWAEADRLPEAWNYLSETNKRVELGMVDTGVDANHVEFAGGIVEQLLAATPKAHGTGVAGIMAAQANNNALIAGVGWNAHIYAVDFNSAGGTTSQIMSAIALAVARGAKAVNVSLGWVGAGSYPDGLTKKNDQDAEARSAALAVSQLVANGYSDFVVVQSAGNRPVDAIQNGLFCSVSLSPNNTGLTAEQARIAFNRILVAGATQRGGGATPYSAKGRQISLFAPGGVTGQTENQLFLPSVNNGYQYTQGTSFSAPQVTATAGWMFAINSNLDGGQVGQLLKMQEVSPVKNGLRTLDCRRALDQAFAAPYLKASGPLQVTGDAVTGVASNTTAGSALAILNDSLTAYGGELDYAKAGNAPNQFAGTGDKVMILRPLGNHVAYTLVVRGDLNGDGRVDARDSQLLQRKQADQWAPPFSEAAFQAAADFDGNGVVNQADVQEIFAQSAQ
jgi:hypothetical protein